MNNEMTAEEAAEILENMAEKDFQSDGAHFEADENIAINYAASILRRVASGELRPVVHAHWIPDSSNPDNDPLIAMTIEAKMPLRCSYCGGKFIGSESKYCGDCGALMDEKDDNDDAD